MTASLHHAQPVLAAAINAGFRESGVQSLKNLEDGNAFPMVAVRSAGLGFESLVGFWDDGDGGKGEERGGKVLSLVDEKYLELLVELGNERFVANGERIERFRSGLMSFRRDELKWENADARRERKRKEGLERKGLEAKSGAIANGVLKQSDHDAADILAGMIFE